MSMGDIRFLEILLSPAATAAQRPPAGGHGFCPEMNACGQKKTARCAGASLPINSVDWQEHSAPSIALAGFRALISAGMPS